MTKLTSATLALLLALSLTAFGCGGGGDESNLTKAQVLKQGDEICAKTDKEQETALRAYSPQNQKQLSTQAGIEKLVVEIGLPPIKAQAEALAELGAPKDDDGTFDEIVGGMEDALEEAEEDPSSMEEGPNSPFAEVNKLAQEYGFVACADAA